MVYVDDIDWSGAMVEHVARHGVHLDDVEDVVFGTPFVTRGREGTYRFVGQTRGGRFLTVVLVRREASLFAVVTARDATPEGRRAFRRRK